MTQQLEIEINSLDSTHTEEQKQKLEWKKQLIERVGRIQNACGELCEFKESSMSNENSMFRSLTADVDCEKLMASEDIDAKDSMNQVDVPNELMNLFTLNGLINVQENSEYKNVSYQSSTWTMKLIEERIKQHRDASKSSPARVLQLKEGIKRLNVRGKSILVVGNDDNPWVETMLLSAGARNVTSLNPHRVISSRHRRIIALTPSMYRIKYFASTLGKFDGVVTLSAIDRVGLGLYDDTFNPWGDIISVGRAWCNTKPGGFMLLSLPSGKDKIQFHSHREYGPYRWSLITTNWRLDDTESNTFDRKSVDGNNLFSFTKVG